MSNQVDKGNVIERFTYHIVGLLGGRRRRSIDWNKVRVIDAQNALANFSLFHQAEETAAAQCEDRFLFTMPRNELNKPLNDNTMTMK